jgi:hypothetical protein
MRPQAAADRSPVAAADEPSFYLAASRPFLESHVPARVRVIPNLRFLDRCDIVVRNRPFPRQRRSLPPSAERAFRTRVRNQRLAAGGSTSFLRLSSLWDIYSATLASADLFRHAK